ncbi:MAG TPA: sel1 repeat family protein [Gammaproteobacteria bacterium]|nr:sel1 repeat family protein [Gammaproteobacteria bacterium]
MKRKNLIIRAVMLLVMLVFAMVFTPVHSQGKNAYNAGLLASEAGDYAAAVVAWQPLASEGDAAAQFNLALMYHRGLGVATDEQKAVQWYKKSAANGYVKAQEFLAAAYREGWFGLEKDPQKAKYWDQQLENNGF